MDHITDPILRTGPVTSALETGDLGEIVRSVRKARHVTLAELAARCGYSPSTISRLETGRQPLRDVQVLRSLAAALAIPARLLGLADTPRQGAALAMGAARVSATLPDEEIDPMRRRTLLAGLTGMAGSALLPSSAVADPVAALEGVLLSPPTAPASSATARLTASHVAAARALFQQGRYIDLATRLPSLLATAHASRGHAATGADLASANGNLAGLYTLASELSVKLGRDRLAWTAADRAVLAATDSADPLTDAVARRQWAIVLRRAGHPALAQRLVIDTATALQPDLHRGPDQLAVYGSLLAAAAYSAATEGDRHNAQALLDEATTSAARLAGKRSERVPVFSPAWVGVYRINTARVLGDYGTALDVARHLPAATIPEPEQRARYWATLARVFHEWGKPERCYRALLAAEQASPDEVHYRGRIQDITQSLLSHPTASSMPGLRAFAGRIGSTA
ncbi:MAG: helix-turn-helix domain-containing protein [Pseudonocardia sp.]